MLVVAILGILAALAIPAFNTYVRRSRAAEASELIKHMFLSAAAYYQPDRAEQGVAGLLQVACVVGSTHNGVTPSSQKAIGDYSAPEWEALGFNVGFSYYRFEIETSGGARCLVSPNTVPVYTFRARGDLDGDGRTSLYELVTATNADNALYHSRGFYIVDGYE
jgi:hypothetical protein